MLSLSRLKELQQQMVGGEQANNEEVKERRRKKKKHVEERKRRLQGPFRIDKAYHCVCFTSLWWENVFA